MLILCLCLVSALVVDETIDDLPHCTLPAALRGTVHRPTNATALVLLLGGIGVEPGDEIHLEGEFVLSQYVAVTLRGSIDLPIVVRAVPVRRATLRQVRAQQNLFDATIAHTFWFNISFAGQLSCLNACDLSLAEFVVVKDSNARCAAVRLAHKRLFHDVIKRKNGQVEKDGDQQCTIVVAHQSQAVCEQTAHELEAFRKSNRLAKTYTVANCQCHTWESR
jgi:hypothetical protein